MITSDTWAPSTPARSSAALMAILPSSCAGRLANAPLNAPTGVRAALTMTMSSCITLLLMLGGQRAGIPPLPTVRPVVPGVLHVSAGLCRPRYPAVPVNASRLDLPYVHPGAIDPCQSPHGRPFNRHMGRPAGPACHKTIAGAAETAYFDGAAPLLPQRQAIGEPENGSFRTGPHQTL